MKMTLILTLTFLSFSLSAAELPAWMAGTWASNSNDVRAEEHWSSSDGGLMLGLHRDVGPKGTSFEFLRIEKKGDSLVLLAMPGGRPATAFPLKSATARRIVFENLAHDFPQRVIYWMQNGSLCARVEGSGGEEAAEEWCWTRVVSDASRAQAARNAGAD